MGLAVESSFISIKDVYFEHRLYYPAAGFVLFLVGMIMYERKGCVEKAEQCKPQSSEINMETGLEEVSEDYTDVISIETSFEDTESISEDSLKKSEMSISLKNRYMLKKPISVLLITAAILIPVYTGLTIYRNYIYGDSIRLWSDVVKKAPGSDRAHSVLASGYLNEYSEEKGNTECLDMAEKEFKIAIDMNKSNSTAHCNLSKVYLLKKEYDKCIYEAKETLKLTKSEYAAYNLGTAYKETGRLDEALREYLKGYDYNNRNSFILKALGETYYELNDLENAKKYYEEYLEVNKRYNNKEIEDKLEEIKSKIEA
jgi:tetratricopeptide (TPR) repeat protein